MQLILSMVAAIYQAQDAHITTEQLELLRRAGASGFVKDAGASLTFKYIIETAIIDLTMLIIWLLFVLDVTQKYMMIELSRKEEETESGA